MNIINQASVPFIRTVSATFPIYCFGMWVVGNKNYKFLMKTEEKPKPEGYKGQWTKEPGQVSPTCANRMRAHFFVLPAALASASFGFVLARVRISSKIKRYRNNLIHSSRNDNSAPCTCNTVSRRRSHRPIALTANDPQR